MDLQSIRLTQTVKKGGCAAKLPAGELRSLLSQLEIRRPSELIVGVDTLDDACLYDLKNGEFLVQTVDFFTPIVDDAHDFGAIAATNAISDVYAMGGDPKVALTVLCFPSSVLPIEILKPLMQGALSKIHEAGACLAGGHTIDDDSLKLGFNVTGFVKKGMEWKNSGARVGDVLILTKGLGTGTIATAIKEGEAKPEWVQNAVASMTTLNRAHDLLEGIEVHAATDITGFGLAGHSLQMAKASGVRFEYAYSKLPWIDGARDSLKNEMTNRAHKTNWDYVRAHTLLDPDLDLIAQHIFTDAQTSGGLLLAVPKAQADQALKNLKGRFSKASVIGKVLNADRPENILALKS